MNNFVTLNKLTQWSLTAALAGFLFGFDTVVISGADQKLQSLWDSSDLFHGFVVMATALWGTVVGSLLGSIPTRKLGRKKTLLWIGVFYTISAIGSALANDPFVFAVFAFTMVLQLAFVYFLMPETKGISLEQLSQKLIN